MSKREIVEVQADLHSEARHMHMIFTLMILHM